MRAASVPAFTAPSIEHFEPLSELLPDPLPVPLSQLVSLLPSLLPPESLLHPSEPVSDDVSLAQSSLPVSEDELDESLLQPSSCESS